MRPDELTPELMNFSSLGIRPDSRRMSRLLVLLGSPESTFPAIHVLGTNGKGSTAASIESVLRSSGAKTALFTSPHLLHLSERLLVDGKQLDDDVWRAAFKRVRQAAEGDSILRSERPTFFEDLTAASFLLISEAHADIAVIEAGMGGRTDATAHCNAIGSVFTPIGLDHTEYLGDTVEAIAAEKFAAIHAHSHAFFPSSDRSLWPIFTDACRDVSAAAHDLAASAPTAVSLSLNGTTFSVPGMRDLHTSLIGLHQAENAASAVAAVRTLSDEDALPAGVRIDEQTIRAGIAATRWPGRFELFSPDDGLPPVIVDGAHNAHGIAALVRTVRAFDPSDLSVGAVVFGAMREKDLTSVLLQLKDLHAPIYAAEPPSERALPCTELADAAKMAGITAAGAFDDPFKALERARHDVKQGSCVLCCGSLYLIGLLRGALAR